MSTIAIITIIIVVMIFLSFAMGAFLEALKGPDGKKLTEQEKNKNSLDR